MGTKDEDKQAVQKGFKSLLDDPKGSKSLEFESYLRKHGHFTYLEFIWACQGMKTLIRKEDSQRNKQLVTCLYRQYILNGSLSTALSNTAFLNISERISQHFESFQKCQVIDEVDIFKEAEVEVEDYLALVVYPQFLKEINGDEGITRDKKCDDESVRSQRSIINEDGLPQLPKLEGMNFPDLSCPSKPPINPETFAKELCQKLEALQVSRNQQTKMDSTCRECEKEEVELRRCFSTKLAKAIEAKLLIYNGAMDSNLMNAEEPQIKKSSEKSTSKLNANPKPCRNRKHRRRKKEGFILKTLCGFNTTGNDDSTSLLSFNSINSTSTDTTTTSQSLQEGGCKVIVSDRDLV